MAVNEARLWKLFAKLVEVLGEECAEILMEVLMSEPRVASRGLPVDRFKVSALEDRV